MSRQQYFIAGTDTDAGKTLVAAAILHKARTLGMSTFGLKPVAAGCEPGSEGLRNRDAQLLQLNSTLVLPYDTVNPVAFEPPIAPHIAAQQMGRPMLASKLADDCRKALEHTADLAVVEGAGGWRVPLNSNETLADMVKALQLPVILVVGMKLGCLNHALLTVEAIDRDGLVLAGWVANHIAPEMACYEENLATLHDLMPAPCLGEIPHLALEEALSEERESLANQQWLVERASTHIRLESL